MSQYNALIEEYIRMAKTAVKKPIRILKIIIGFSITLLTLLLFAFMPYMDEGGFVFLLIYLGVVSFLISFYKMETASPKKVLKLIDQGDYIVALRVLQSLTLTNSIMSPYFGAYYAEALGFLQQALAVMRATQQSSASS